WGEALPRSGGDEGQLHFRNFENIRKQTAPLVFQKFLPKYSENQKCATPLIRFAFAQHLPPKGKATILPYFRGFPLPAENFAYKIFFGKNAQPLRGFPSGGRWQGVALTDEGQFATERQPGVAVRRRW
ncbi:MAG: hypothetical protein ACLTKZ_04665, partial [Lachnospiraceae bacterium]